MRCPVDDALLVVTERSGVEIDHCPQCRGVWLDRGELDKIIDRSLIQPQQQYPQPRFDDRGYQQGYNQPYRKKKESWLSELFD